MGLNTNALARVRALLDNPKALSDEQLMTEILRTSAKWRSMLISNTVINTNGRAVLHGPFAGMQYVTEAAEGALAPRLIGAYESELHPHILAFAREGLEQVVDVGCAEGYYAVGLARLMPEVVVHAYDIDAKARTACAELAALNGVSDRVRIGETFTGEDFARFADTRTLVFMDIEGHERTLLDPERWPALKTLPIIVETHPGPTFARTKEIADRFAPTHDIIRIHQGGKTTPLPAWLHSLSHLDQLLAVWEWRVYPTPWLVMRPKAA